MVQGSAAVLVETRRFPKVTVLSLF